MGYEIKKVEDGETSILSPKIDNSISKVFDKLIQVGESDIITKGNCKLCNHSLRGETELKWEGFDFNYSKTTDWLNEQIKDLNEHLDEDERELYFNVNNVRTHMKNHYREQERQIRLRDYSERIEDIVNIKQNRAKMLDTSLAVCLENLSKVASAETYGDIKSEKDRSDAINKVVAQMLKVIELQNKLEADIDTTEAIQEKFVSVWVNMINKEESDAKKKILVNMLEDFVGEQE